MAEWPSLPVGGQTAVQWHCLQQEGTVRQTVTETEDKCPISERKLEKHLKFPTVADKGEGELP